jgi:uracil phosphoribosyltransferase
MVVVADKMTATKDSAVTATAVVDDDGSDDRRGRDVLAATIV